MGEEVCRVWDEEDKTAFDLGCTADVGELEEESCTDSNDNANQQTTKENQQEDTSGFKEAEDTSALVSGIVVALRSLENDNGNGVVENGFTENNGVQLRVDLVGVENGENRYGIRGGESCADGDGVDKGQVEGSGDTSEDVENQTNDDGGEERSSKGESQDCSNISKEIRLV